MKSRSLFVLGVGVTALSLFAVACGEDDDPAPANTGGKGGSAGSSAGAAGTGGSAGAAAGAAGAAAGTGGSAGAAAGTGGSAGAAAGTGGSAGAAAGAGGANGGSAGAASGKKFGLVSLSQSVTEFVPGTKAFTTVGIASFQTTANAGSSTTTCKTATDGACSIIECETTDGGAGGGSGAAGAPAAPTYLSAGDITITGLKSEVKLSFKDAASGYAPVIGNAALWDGGETGKFTAAGTADIPTFTGESGAPGTVVFSKPAPVAPGTKIPVDSAAAFDLAWDADAKAKVTVSLNTSDASKKKSTIVNCAFDGATKSASVPASVTAKLQKGGDASILIGTGNTKVVTAGDYDVNLTLTSAVVTGLAEVK